MNVGNIQDLFQVQHPQSDILIQIGKHYVPIKEIKRVIHEGKIAHVLIPIDPIYPPSETPK